MTLHVLMANAVAAGTTVAAVDQDQTMTTLVSLIVIFVLAMFVGFEVITKVPSLLHTPLMSGSNAISGITVIGSLVVAGTGNMTLAKIMGVAALVFAMINVVGGYMVTDRMLQMFKKKPEAKK
jgi:NAD(P) transhydrogenase subunit alpha